MQPPGPGPTDCRPLVEQTVDTMRRVVDADIRLQVDLPGAPTWVDAPANDLFEVLVGLLRAGCDAVAHRPSGRVSTRLQVGVRVEIEVRDDGPGLGSEELANVFLERGGARSPTAAALFECSRRVAALGGQFQVESGPGRGTRCRVSLPQAG